MRYLDYEIIFYHSGKTAEIERTINLQLSQIEMNMLQSFAATTPTELAQMLGQSLERVDAVIIVGGLDGGKQSTDNVLSTILSTNGLKMESNKIVDDKGNIAYIIRCLEQTIIVFPDETSVIASMLKMKISALLAEIYKLKVKKSSGPSIESVTKELDRQLSDISKTRTKLPYGNEKKIKQSGSLRKLKIAITVLAALAAVQLVTAACLYYINFIM